MKDLFIKFIIAIGPGVISSAIFAFICYILRYFFTYKKSEFSGKWKCEIFDENDNLVKADEYNIKHNKKTNVMSGKGTRCFPLDQNHRKWSCHGMINGEHIIVVFWSNNPMIKSDGSVYAVHKGDYVYEGWYLTVINSDNSEIVKKSKLILTKYH